MRVRSSILLWGACAGSALAQAPLAIDPGFRLFVAPQWMEQHSGRVFTVVDIVQRPDGNYLISGRGIVPPLEQPQWPGGVRSMIITPQGQHVPSAFDVEGGGGRITELPNGQYFLGGHRFNHDGTRDWTFNPDTRQWNNSDRWGYFVNDDGTVFYPGFMTLYVPDTSRWYGLIRLDSTGHLDSTFTHRKVDDAVLSIFPLRNGQFLLSGLFTMYDERSTGPVVRIHPDGALDTTFSFPYSLSTAQVVHELPDGRCLIGGGPFWGGRADTAYLVRVFPDGSLDPGFNHRTAYRIDELTNNPFIAAISALGPINEGRFLVGGNFTSVDRQTRGGIACVDTSGNLLHDCWASEGLRPTHYTGSANRPNLWLANYKHLPDGTQWIMGQYKGIVDQVQEYPDQVLLSKLYPLDVGMEERQEKRSHMEVWPNPGSEGFTVVWDAAHHGPAQLELRDARGRLVRTEQATSSSFTVEAGDLPMGLYLLRLVHGQGVYMAKWTKE